VRDAEFGINAFREELDGRHMLPARGAHEGFGLDGGAIGEVDGVGRETSDVRNMDVNGTVPHQVEDVGGIIENGERRGSEHGLAPGFKLGRLGVRSILIQRDHIAPEDGPEGVGDCPTDGSSVVEVPHRCVAIGFTPSTRAEPGKHPCVYETRWSASEGSLIACVSRRLTDELFQPFLQRRNVWRGNPDGAVAAFCQSLSQHISA
jgi:hypothetical protein